MTDTSPERPPWVKPRITAAPKIRQVYWCEFWQDARLPEMWKIRPVIVVSYKNTLHGTCFVIPVSTEPQDDNKWACRLASKIDGKSTSWAICNQPSTVSTSRFIQSNKGFILPKDEFNQVIERFMLWLPKPFSLDK